MALELVKLSPRAVDARCTSSTFQRKWGRMGKLRSTMRMLAVGHQHGHGEAVDDEVALPPGLDVEEVVADRGAEELADLVVVARVGERAGEQALEIALQPVPGMSRLRQPVSGEQALELGERQGARVRRVAQLLHGVERVRLVGGGELSATTTLPPGRHTRFIS